MRSWLDGCLTKLHILGETMRDNYLLLVLMLAGSVALAGPPTYQEKVNLAKRMATEATQQKIEGDRLMSAAAEAERLGDNRGSTTYRDQGQRELAKAKANHDASMALSKSIVEVGRENSAGRVFVPGANAVIGQPGN